MTGSRCNDLALCGRGQGELETAVDDVDKDIAVAFGLTLALAVARAEHESELLHRLIGGDTVIATDIADGKLPEVRALVAQLILIGVVAP